MPDLPRPYKLTFAQRPHYLYACIESDTIDAATALQYLGEIAKKCSELSTERLMIYRDIPDTLSDGDLFFVTNKFIGLTGRTRVALVNPYAANHKDMEFAIMIGNNRGADYEVFTSAADAERWLVSGLDPE